MDKQSQEFFSETVNRKEIGKRLLEAFKEECHVEDKQVIAETLGFSSNQAVYKIISGEREMGFATLIKFRSSTKRTIDWLLTGEGEKRVTSEELELATLTPGLPRNVPTEASRRQPGELEDVLRDVVRGIVREEIGSRDSGKVELLPRPSIATRHEAPTHAEGQKVTSRSATRQKKSG